MDDYIKSYPFDTIEMEAIIRPDKEELDRIRKVSRPAYNERYEEIDLFLIEGKLGINYRDVQLDENITSTVDCLVVELDPASFDEGEPCFNLSAAHRSNMIMSSYVTYVYQGENWRPLKGVKNGGGQVEELYRRAVIDIV